jgi:3'-phosphoadenosine 5'-phosphosulfate sulfotransferase (PAPS reductase)/FAD synthetase
MDQSKRPARHILSLSGGKDSAALAIYMRDRVPEMEYIFNDTGKELPETYDYLDQIQDYLGKPIVRTTDRPGLENLGFDHWYHVYGEMIPSGHRRWCTKMLKLKPFELYVGFDTVYNYIGLRADENRKGYISGKPNIIPLYPFSEDGLVLADIEKILIDSGIGMPPYTKWGRTRSGCFFCFFQQKIEWVRLKQTHPDLFAEAKKYERVYEKTGNFFTWSQGESLQELERPERMEEIIREAERQRQIVLQNRENLTLFQVFSEVYDPKEDDEDEQACLICKV